MGAKRFKRRVSASCGQSGLRAVTFFIFFPASTWTFGVSSDFLTGGISDSLRLLAVGASTGSWVLIMPVGSGCHINLPLAAVYCFCGRVNPI